MESILGRREGSLGPQSHHHGSHGQPKGTASGGRHGKDLCTTAGIADTGDQAPYGPCKGILEQSVSVLGEEQQPVPHNVGRR